MLDKLARFLFILSSKIIVRRTRSIGKQNKTKKTFRNMYTDRLISVRSECFPFIFGPIVNFLIDLRS